LQENGGRGAAYGVVNVLAYFLLLLYGASPSWRLYVLRGGNSFS